MVSFGVWHGGCNLRENKANNPSVFLNYLEEVLTMTTATEKINAWDRIMMAITFAEADDEKTARELLGARKNEQRPRSHIRKEADRRPELRM